MSNILHRQKFELKVLPQKRVIRNGYVFSTKHVNPGQFKSFVIQLDLHKFYTNISAISQLCCQNPVLALSGSGMSTSPSFKELFGAAPDKEMTTKVNTLLSFFIVFCVNRIV